VLRRDDGTFEVEVSILESHPATVRLFATQQDAEAWIADHRARVKTQTSGQGVSTYRSFADRQNR
jgi:hypothetical protein